MNIYQDLPALPHNKPSPLRPDRAKRLRTLWFVLGVCAGILLTRAVDTALENSAKAVEEFGSLRGLQTVFVKNLLRDDDSLTASIAKAEGGVGKTDNAANAVASDTGDVRSITAPAKRQEIASLRAEYPKQLTLGVSKGDTLLDILKNSGLDDGESYRIIQTLKPLYNPRRLRTGHKFSLTIDKNNDGELLTQRLEISISPQEKILLTRDSGGELKAHKESLPLVTKTVRAGGTITSSLYQTAKSSGLPENMIAELINAYSYDVDFQRDIKRGDVIDVLFEQVQTESGKAISGSKVLHATLTIGGRKIAVYRYTDSKGNSGYYNAKGESVRKALLKTPINGARISSRFGKRRHPVLGYTKMHKGLDFAAARGTPVYAAGDGVVERASRYGSYGNYVRIRHNDKYSTAYAHLKRFGKNIRSGRRVRQGQVIGYVGTTGRSTGPHLHYEILAYGRQINPSGVKFKTGRKLRGKELARFRTKMRELNSLIAALPYIRTEVAAAGEL